MLFFGLDHSLTAFGLAAARSDWGGDVRQVRRVTLATKPDQGSNARRRAMIAGDVVSWIGWQIESLQVPRSDVRVLIESGIFNAKMVNSIRSQEGLAAVVAHEVLRVLGLEIAIAQQRSVRRTFMGNAVPPRGIGVAAQELLKAIRPETTAWDEAELDALLIANHGLAEAGEAFISCAPPVDAAPKKRSSRMQALQLPHLTDALADVPGVR